MNKKYSILLSLVLTVGCSFLPGGSNPSGPMAESTAPAPGSVLFLDDFSNPASGWERVSDAEGIMDYDDGVYRILVKGSHVNYFATPGRSFNDTRVEVDAVKIDGPDDNRAGIICRMSQAGDSARYYFFIITNSGYYAVGRAEGGQGFLLGQSALAQSSAIKTGLSINHLRADCIGSTLSFYINGFLVSQVSDNALTGGEAGLMAGTFDQTQVDMIFDEFVVLQP